MFIIVSDGLFQTVGRNPLITRHGRNGEVQRTNGRPGRPASTPPQTRAELVLRQALNDRHHVIALKTEPSGLGQKILSLRPNDAAFGFA
jgi:hypothetical protein